MIGTLYIAIWSIVNIKVLICAALDKGGGGLNDKREDVFVWVGEFELLRMNVHNWGMKMTPGATLDRRLFLEKDAVPLSK